MFDILNNPMLWILVGLATLSIVSAITFRFPDDERNINKRSNRWGE